MAKLERERVGLVRYIFGRFPKFYKKSPQNRSFLPPNICPQAFLGTLLKNFFPILELICLIWR